MEPIVLEGVIKKLVDHHLSNQPKYAQIGLSGAGYMYDELRVPNVYEWKLGDEVEVTVYKARK